MSKKRKNNHYFVWQIQEVASNRILGVESHGVARSVPFRGKTPCLKLECSNIFCFLLLQTISPTLSEWSLNTEKLKRIYRRNASNLCHYLLWSRTFLFIHRFKIRYICHDNIILVPVWPSFQHYWLSSLHENSIIKLFQQEVIWFERGICDV